MALATRSDANRITYLQIADYSICEKYSKEQDGDGWEILKTTDRDGKEYTSWVKRYRNVSGLISGIEYVTRTLPGKNINVSSWKISLFDEILKERYVLSIPATSPAASRFLKLAENIDPGQHVEFNAWKDTSDVSGPKLAFMVKQNGVNIPQKYTIKEGALFDYANEGWEDAPKVKVLKNGTKSWTEVEEFLFERMESVVAPRFLKNAELIKGSNSEDHFEGSSDADDGSDDTGDDIPF